MIQSAFSGGCLTAPGNGGLQVFLVTGVGVESFVAKIFRPSRRVPLSGRTLRHGHLVSEDTVVDEVLLACDPGRASVEISAHGGEATRHAVEHLLRSRGVAWLEASELSRREVGSCFGAGLHRAAREAMDRAYAPSAVGFFLEVCDGALGHEIVALAQALGANSDGAGPDRMSAAASRLETLVARGVLGRAFTQPPLVVLLGAPNAGKSSLANALVGEDVAIVTDQPGTTRDVLRERVLVRGFPFELADTAGLRRSSDPVEREGVARATAVAQRAAIVIHVVDGRRGAADLEDERRELLTSPALTVATHVDLTPGLDIPALEVALRCRVVAWSAVTSVGLERIRDELLFRSPFRGPASSMFPAPFTERQIAWLSAAADDVRNGRGALARERLEALACDGGA